MKQHLVIAVLSVYLLSGCSLTKEVTPPAPLFEPAHSVKLAIYKDTMKKLAKSTTEDPKYQKISLESAKNKEWFRELTYKLWNREITKADFVNEAVQKYPERRYEFEFISEGLNLQR